MVPVQSVNDVEIAFGGSIDKLLPKYADIPDEFKHGRGKWNQLFSDWFYSGLKKLKLEPRDGVNTQSAIRHIKAILVSYEPKHEHKEAGVAYLLNEWFTDATWEKAK